ncbi:MAG: SNF2-related protein [Verrucomicrobiota bacterium]
MDSHAKLAAFREFVRTSDWEARYEPSVLRLGLGLAVGQGKFSAQVLADDSVRLIGAFPGTVKRSAVDLVVRLDRDGNELAITGTCSCVLGNSCPHEVALLFRFCAPPRKKKGRRGRKKTKYRASEKALSLYVVLQPDASITLMFREPGVSTPFRDIDVQLFGDRDFQRNLGEKGPVLDELRDRFEGSWSDEQLVFHPRGKDWPAFLHELAGENLLNWGGGPNPVPLAVGEDRAVEPVWKWDDERQLHVRELQAPLEYSMMIPTEPPVFVDGRRRKVGLAVCEACPADGLAHWLGTDGDWAAWAEGEGKPWAGSFPDRPERITVADEKPSAVLRLVERELPRNTMRSVWNPVYHHLPAGEVCFQYGKHRVTGDGNSISTTDAAVQVKRDEAVENGLLKDLGAVGFQKFMDSLPSHSREKVEGLGGIWWLGEWESEASQKAWMEFFTRDLLILEESGWEIEYDEAFSMRFVEPERWRHQVRSLDRKGWFEFELGIDVEGRNIDLIPVLVKYFESLRDPDDTILRLEKAEGRIPIPLDDGRYVAFPLERLRPILKILSELIREGLVRKGKKVELHRLVAAEVLAASRDCETVGADEAELEALRDRVRDFEGLTKTQLPKGLKATLRDYQREGLDWLQFLGEFFLGGVLADDMGLGKTLQTLTHLLVEKENGRLDKGALIVAPTSVLPNWEAEARKFVPDLSVHVFHGSNRHRRFDEMRDGDLFITSYALVHRDLDRLSGKPFSWIVLDEAQNIKNPAAQSTRAACLLPADHRLCLSGTPMENHLEELWSLFHFLQPGFLGSLERFRAHFRRPIERNGNEAEPNAVNALCFEREMQVKQQPGLNHRDDGTLPPNMGPPQQESVGQNMGRQVNALQQPEERVRTSSERERRVANSNLWHQGSNKPNPEHQRVTINGYLANQGEITHGQLIE